MYFLCPQILNKCSNLIYYIICIFEPTSYVFWGMVVNVRMTVRDVNHCGSLSLFVTEITSSLAICTRRNGDPKC